MFCIPNDYPFQQYKSFDFASSGEEIYEKVYTSDSLLEKVLYWGINFILKKSCLYQIHVVFLKRTSKVYTIGVY